MNFSFLKHSQIPSVIIVDGIQYKDSRGFFTELYRSDEFLKQGIPPFVQENRSHSKARTIRGLHYQLDPKAQGKLVACLNGTILDIAVDIRCGSPTYGNYVAVSLDSRFPRMLYIPPGFAHGFVVMDYYPYSAEVVYKTTEYHSAEHERCIHWCDPDINISWGIMREQAIVSDKDSKAPFLKDAENNFIWIK